MRRSISWLWRATAVVIAATVVFGSSDALAVVGTINGGASATAQATPVDPVGGELVSVYERSTLSDAVRDRAFAAARAVDAPAGLVRGFQVGMQRAERNGAAVFQAPAPDGGLWQVPMSANAMEPATAMGLMGRAFAGQLSAGHVIVSQTSATTHNVQAGDVVFLVSAASTLVPFAVGAVVPDAAVGGSELTMSRDMASALGAGSDTGVIVWGRLDHGAIDNALAGQGLLGNPDVRVRHTWDAQDPDDTLGLARTKQLLGELSFKLTSSGGISVDPGWAAQYIGPREAYPTGIRAQCNATIKADLAAALQDVVNAGLSGAIDVANTNTFGGCFGPRYNRLTANIGNLSRHTWGQPIDMNTTQNCQGCVPRMDCRVVRIFRAHGFAWGGNFLFPDGMHFEWTGRVTDQLQYPSRYCPNPTGTTGTEALPTGPPIGRDTFFDGATSAMPGSSD